VQFLRSLITHLKESSMQILFRPWLAFFIAALLLASQPLRAATPPDFMVDADWLAAEMKNPRLVILEVRYHPHRYHTHHTTRTGISFRSHRL